MIGGIYNPNSEKWGNLELLYIGQAFDQTLRKRIPQDHPAYECVLQYQKEHSNVDIIVLIGLIENSTVERLTQQLFDDVECCLIFCNQPLCNITCKESCSGRAREKCVCSEASF